MHCVDNLFSDGKDPDMPPVSRFSSGLLRVSLVAPLVVLVVGCGGKPAGPPLYQVKGTVKFEGAPLADATVTFRPENGPVAMGVTNANGEFTLKTGAADGAVAGPHQVAVIVATGGKVMDNPTPDDLAAMSLAPKPPAEPKSPIPERYSKFETSRLTATVETDPSKNIFTFDLKQ